MDDNKILGAVFVKHSSFYSFFLEKSLFSLKYSSEM